IAPCLPVEHSVFQAVDTPEVAFRCIVEVTISAAVDSPFFGCLRSFSVATDRPLGGVLWLRELKENQLVLVGIGDRYRCFAAAELPRNAIRPADVDCHVVIGKQPVRFVPIDRLFLAEDRELMRPGNRTMVGYMNNGLTIDGRNAVRQAVLE